MDNRKMFCIPSVLFPSVRPFLSMEERREEKKRGVQNRVPSRSTQADQPRKRNKFEKCTKNLLRRELRNRVGTSQASYRLHSGLLGAYGRDRALSACGGGIRCVFVVSSGRPLRRSTSESEMALRPASCLVFGLLLVLVDLGNTGLGLAWHAPDAPSWPTFSAHFSQPFRFLRSTLDLGLIALVRALFYVVGPVLLLTQSNPSALMNTLSHVVFSLTLLMCAFSPTKLLALTEEKDARLFVGDVLLLVNNFVGAFLMHFAWTHVFLPTSKGGYYELREEDESSESSDSSADSDAPIPPRQTFELIFRLLQYCKREWLWHLSGFSWLFIYSLTRIFVPYYTGQVIASVANDGGYAALVESVKLMTAISLASALAGGLRGGSFEYAYARINRAVRCDLFTSLVHQNVAFYDAHKTGEVTSRLTADTQTMSDTVALNVNVFLRNIVMLGGSMFFMMYLSWKLSLVTFIVVPIILVASKIFGVYYDLLSERTQEAVAQSNDVAEEVLSTMRTVRSFACENIEADRYFDKLTHTMNVTKLKAFAYVGFIWVNELFQALIIVAVLWFGGHLVITQRMDANLLVSFLLYQMQLGDNIRQMGEVWTGLMQSVGASRKVFEYIDRTPDISTDGEHKPERVVGKIEFRNVHFSYPTRPDLPILRDLSFTVEPGQTVALVGPSGSGKSSCIALLEHFYQPDSGEILIDGVPIEQYDHQLIHTKIALVGQEPVLFARSVTENVGYGLDHFTEHDVVEASKMANAHSFIVQTNDKYETNVGEKGSQMSGGQKQRIAIARALVRAPAVLLLDEATSALDTESESLVQEAIYKNLKGRSAIYKNLKGRSVILIAHRLSTVEKADKIVVINKGRVEQQGSHEELIAQPGIYRTLVNRQMIGAADAPVASVRHPLSEIDSASSSSQPIGASPSRSMAKSLLATSFTPSSLQSR
uniref:ABC-type antigen peptide transporter n=1 Tax=Steinernema glaseri TaxID=37863 RepID=A0A1I8AQE6_9BILA